MVLPYLNGSIYKMKSTAFLKPQYIKAWTVNHYIFAISNKIIMSIVLYGMQLLIHTLTGMAIQLNHLWSHGMGGLLHSIFCVL